MNPESKTPEGVETLSSVEKSPEMALVPVLDQEVLEVVPLNRMPPVDQQVGLTGISKKRVRSDPKDGDVHSVLFTSSCPNYSWLPLGWFVEHRTQPTGRLDSFVYEPNDGLLHRSLKSAFDRFRELGISVNENEANRLHRIATKNQKENKKARDLVEKNQLAKN